MVRTALLTMARRPMIRLPLLLLMLLLTQHLMATETLTARVDRTEMHQNETLSLEVKGNMELELSFNGLMSLRELNLPAPDMGDLEKQFEVLNANQAYSINSINGVNKAQVTWTYQLAPKTSGDLTIPALTFQGASSTPIQVKIIAGESSDANNPVRVEAKVSANSVYVQEQLLLTVQLVFPPPLLRGELAQPELKDVIMEPHGQQREFSRMENGQQVQVVERRYLVFPQHSGTLEIPPISFKGRQRGPGGNLSFLNAQSKAVQVEIKPPPASFSGKTWLPASSLSLEEEWTRTPDNLAVGDSVTRVMRLRALGLLGSALPPLEIDYAQPLKAYAEAPEVNSEALGDSVQSLRTERSALVATRTGMVQLPEIRLPWWDTVNDVERVAIIPARTLNIGGVNPATSEPEAEQLPVQPEATLPAETPPSTSNADPASATTDTGSLFWPVLAALLGVGWLATVLAWLWLRKQTARAPATDTVQNVSTQASWSALKNAIKQRSPDTLTLLVNWADLAVEGSGRIRSLADLEQRLNDPDISRLLSELQAWFYAPNTAQKNDWCGDELLKALQQGMLARQTASKGSALPAFSS